MQAAATPMSATLAARIEPPIPWCRMTSLEDFRISRKNATFCEGRVIGAKVIVFYKAPSYPEPMFLVRRILSCLVIATIFAVSMNDVAMAANDLGHQTHCVDAHDKTADRPATDHADGHVHDGLATQHAMPGHDHETCTLHGCPALSADTIKLGELTDTFLAKLSWPEQPLFALERADGLKRPPKT